MGQLSRATGGLLRSVGGKPRAQFKNFLDDDIEDPTEEDTSPRVSQVSLHKKKTLNDTTPGTAKGSEAGRSRSLSKLEDDSDDDLDNGRTGRGAIQSTKFMSPSETREKGGKGTPPKGNGAKVRSTQGANSAKRQKLSDDESNAGVRGAPPASSSQQSSSSKSGKTPKSSSEHMLTDFGWAKTNKPRINKTYGGGVAAGRGGKTRPAASQGRQTALQKKFGGSQGKSKAKAQEEVTSAKFKRFEADENEEGPTTDEEDGGFQKPKGISPVSSPIKSSIPTEFQGVGKDDDADIDTASTPRPRFKMQSPGSTAKSKPRIRPPRRKKRAAVEEEPETQQAPVFQMFDDNDNLDLSPVVNRQRSGSPALSDLGSVDNRDTQRASAEPEMVEDSSQDQDQPTATLCPWCGEPVEEQLLQEFSKGKRMNVRQQTRFCRKHKRQKAEEAWSAKSYPTIDWEELPDRIATHYDALLDIIDGTGPSHYRTRLAEKIEAGADRAMRKEENLNPGYYGPRGFNLMCDCLVDRFGDLLKQKAVHDRVISGRGSAAFIQTVLVAELAVQLIKDDMCVSAEEAREIVEGSKDIGEMIHEEA